jgi:hypothetical protein
MATNTTPNSGSGLSSSILAVYKPALKKFEFIGPGLDKSSLTMKTSLSMVEMMQIIKLYEAGVFREMIENNTMHKEVETAHPDAASTFFTTPIVPPERERRASSSSSEGSAPSPPTIAGGGNRMYHEYVKIVKAQNPDLTHKQALVYASNGYKEWKASQK